MSRHGFLWAYVRFTELLESVGLWLSPTLWISGLLFLQLFFLYTLSPFFLELLWQKYLFTSSLRSLSFCYSDWTISIDLSSISLTFSSAIFIQWVSYFGHCIFSCKFPFDSLYLLSFDKTFYLSTHFKSVWPYFLGHLKNICI